MKLFGIKSLVLVGVVFLILVASSYASFPVPPTCEVLEKPENINIKCRDVILAIEDDVTKLELIESPENVDKAAFLDYQQGINLSTDYKKEYEEKLEIKGFYINLREAHSYGNFKFRINDEYDIKVLYGGNYIQQANLTFYSFIIGIAIIFGSLVLFFVKRKNEITLGLFCLGLLLVLNYINPLYLFFTSIVFVVLGIMSVIFKRTRNLGLIFFVFAAIYFFTAFSWILT